MWKERKCNRRPFLRKREAEGLERFFKFLPYPHATPPSALDCTTTRIVYPIPHSQRAMAPHLPLNHHHHHDTTTTTTTPTTTTAKGQHYAQTLDLARRLSLFTSKYPAELKSGNLNQTTAATDGMDWNELLRKFRKHNPNRIR
jgi:hypothetical protein